MTSADLKFVPQAKAFAVDGEKNPSIPTTSTTAMNLATGFPSVYSKPLAEGGKLIQRKEMNTLFYQLMLFQNFLQNGGYITWNADVMNGIGGYPNGAVLSLIDSVTGAETRIQSCVDNNYLQPTAESIGAKYRVNTSTVPHTYTKDEGGNVIWRYCRIKPQVFDGTILKGETLVPNPFKSTYTKIQVYVVENDCGLYIGYRGNINDNNRLQFFANEHLVYSVESSPGDSSSTQYHAEEQGIIIPLRKGTVIKAMCSSKDSQSGMSLVFTEYAFV